MKIYRSILVFLLSAVLLCACTPPLENPEGSDTTVPDAQTTAQSSATETPTFAETDHSPGDPTETEGGTMDEAGSDPYPETVYMYLSQEDVDRYLQSLGGSLPFNLVSGAFITGKSEHTRTVLDHQSDKTFTLNGMRQTLRYDHSMVSSSGEQDAYDVYTDGETTYRVYRDGSLHSYNCPDLHRGSADTPISDEMARQIAADFLEANFPDYDFSEYTVSIQKLTGDVTSTHATIVTYMKRTQGYFLGDKLDIEINSDGLISIVHAEDLGCSAAFGWLTKEQIEVAREQLLNSIIAAVRIPFGSELLKIGSDGNLYMYMSGNGWTFNEQGMKDENSQEVTETYYIRLDP